MSTTLVVTASQRSEMLAAAQRPVESAAILAVRVVETSQGNRRILVRKIHWIPDQAYSERSATGLELASDAFVPALAAVARDQSVAIWMHTHPSGSAPLPSRKDVLVDESLADTFRIRTGAAFYGQLIISIVGDVLEFSGYLRPESGADEPIDRTWTVGERFLLTPRHGTAALSPLAQFDRSVRAFGPAIQSTLGDLHVGIVGCGGTGSAVAEQLARLGVQRFTIVDHKSLSKTNRTRVYGSFPESEQQNKAQVLRSHLLHIEPDVVVEAVETNMAMSESAARRLDDCDLVFGCTDDNAGRVVLSRLASVLLTPVIDVGVILDSQDEILHGIFGRVTILAPGAACLVCRKRIDLAAAAAEVLSDEERAARVADGYAPEMAGVEPAVITFTTMVAALATGELLNRLTGFGDEAPPSELLLLAHDHRIARNQVGPRAGHYCEPETTLFASGIEQPFLGLSWTE